MSRDVPTKEVDLGAQEPVDSPPSDRTRRVDLRPADGTRRVMVDRPARPSQVVPIGFLSSGEVLLGQYEVLETIHPHETERAGVFICRDGKRQVVVKVAALDHPPKAELWDRLQGLEHPHILKVFQTFEKEGHFCEVQEYCAGGSLSKKLAKERFTADWVMAAPLIA